MRRPTVWLLVIAVVFGVAGCGGTSGTSARPAEAPLAAGRSDVGFRSAARLDEHFRKHGREFGSITRADYLAMAQALRDRPAAGPILEVVRRDGVVTRFDRSTGAFVAFEDDGVIRTFFRPNDGEEYFVRQARR